MELTTIFSGRRSFGESRGGEFLENAVVHGIIMVFEMGCAKLAEGADVLLNIDVQGAATIRDGAAVTKSWRKRLSRYFLCRPVWRNWNSVLRA